MKPHSSTFFSWHLPRHVLTACGLLLLASLTPTVHAACTPFVQPVRYVGPLGVGSQCTDATIQDAINNSTCTHGNTIYVSPYGLGGTRTYSNQHLTINNKNVTLIGESGTYGCGTPPLYCLGLISDPVNCVNPSGPVITLDGNNTNGSVIQITGNSNVSLKFLEVKRGNKNGSGGGISFLGNGSLSLMTSDIISNQATYGGGIDATSSGGDLTVTLYENVTIGVNTATQSGGGLRIQGAGGNSVTLNAKSPKLFIANNEATNAYGGGVELVGKTIANIGSSGVPGAGTIILNRAAYGGGIAAIAGDGDAEHAAITLFSTDANNPVRVGSNRASHAGGALYLRCSYAILVGVYAPGAARANLWDFQLDDNVAQNGAAIYGDLCSSGIDSSGKDVSVNLNSGTRPLGSAACAESARCNAISGNATRDIADNTTSGSVILMQSRSQLLGNRFRLENNIADHAIHGFDSQLALTNCLIADNTINSDSILRNDNESANNPWPSKIRGCTFVNNQFTSTLANRYTLAMYARGALELFGNIFDNSSPSTASLPTIRYDGSAMSATYNLVRETASLNGGVGNIVGSATFFNPTAKDYHLMPGSLGVDHVPASGGDDLAGNPRDVDLSIVQIGYTSGGPRDVGAFEIGCQATYIAGAYCSLDVDGDNRLTTTDTLMMLRWLFGFKASTLRAGLPGPGSCAQRTSPAEIEAFMSEQISPNIFLPGSRAEWDIDGNGKVDAMTDGLLVLRAQLGLTGTAVTRGAIGNNNPARPDWTSVRSYLNNTCGMTLP